MKPEVFGTVLVVEDEEALARVWKRILDRESIASRFAQNIKSSMEMLEKEKEIAVVLADLRLPDGSGMDLVRYIKENRRDVCVNIITGQATVEGAVECMKLGACDYVAKPFNIAEMEAKVRRCLLHWKKNREIGRLQKEVQEFRELDRLKSEFISAVSHELRTPLFSMQGALDLLLEDFAGRLKGSSAQLAEVIRSNMSRLTRLVLNILNFSRLEQGNLKPRFERVDLAELARLITRDLSPLSRQKNITVRLEAQEMKIPADREQMEQLLVNLIGNAVKFTPPGGRIEVRIYKEKDCAALEISDTGSGIAEENQEKIFDRFYQVDGTLSREAGGAGIGLALVKAIVQMHTGTVRVKSVLGRGSVFSVLLPLNREKKP